MTTREEEIRAKIKIQEKTIKKRRQ